MRALARAADVFRCLICRVGEGQEIDKLWRDHNDLLTLSDSVVEAWLRHLHVEREEASEARTAPRKRGPRRKG